MTVRVAETVERISRRWLISSRPDASAGAPTHCAWTRPGDGRSGGRNPRRSDRGGPVLFRGPQPRKVRLAVRALFVIAVAALAGFLISPLVHADAACPAAPAAS